MLDFGVTTVEIKSGYGLDSENELKQLRVIRRLGGACAQDIAATFLGAHAIPDEYAGNADGYIDFIIERVLPVVTEQGLADFAMSSSKVPYSTFRSRGNFCLRHKNSGFRQKCMRMR